MKNTREDAEGSVFFQLFIIDYQLFLGGFINEKKHH